MGLKRHMIDFRRHLDMKQHVIVKQKSLRQVGKLMGIFGKQGKEQVDRPGHWQQEGEVTLCHTAQIGGTVKTPIHHEDDVFSFKEFQLVKKIFERRDIWDTPWIHLIVQGHVTLFSIDDP